MVLVSALFFILVFVHQGAWGFAGGEAHLLLITNQRQIEHHSASIGVFCHLQDGISLCKTAVLD